MSEKFPIYDVVALLNIPHKEVSAGQMNCKCPFCKSSGYKMNVRLDGSNVWRCARCGAGGGSIQLYTAYTRGVPYTKSMREEIIPELSKALGLDEEYKGRANIRAKSRRGNWENSTGTQYSEISDYSLNLFYQKLLENPLLSLTPEDNASLRKRGLTNEAIVRNQYRSFSIDVLKKAIPEEISKRYDAENWAELLKTNQKLAKFSKEKLLTSILLGESLISKENQLVPSGLPGTFKFRTESKTYWCFNWYEGILIPVRNYRGEIVALQVRSRLKEASNKYLMISSVGLPAGRRAQNRMHHPLANQEGSRKTAKGLLLTEGPLKGDVWSCIAKDHPCKVLALIGVNGTKHLENELRYLNPSEIFEAFDMDKLLNPSVMNGIKQIKAICKEAEIPLYHLFWDEKGVKSILNAYEIIAEGNGVALTPNVKNSAPQVQLCWIATLLKEKGVKVPKSAAKWPGTSKGIDDYILWCSAG